MSMRTKGTLIVTIQQDLEAANPNDLQKLIGKRLEALQATGWRIQKKTVLERKNAEEVTEEVRG